MDMYRNYAFEDIDITFNRMQINVGDAFMDYMTKINRKNKYLYTYIPNYTGVISMIHEDNMSIQSILEDLKGFINFYYRNLYNDYIHPYRIKSSIITNAVDPSSVSFKVFIPISEYNHQNDSSRIVNNSIFICKVNNRCKIYIDGNLKDYYIREPSSDMFSYMYRNIDINEFNKLTSKIDSIMISEGLTHAVFYIPETNEYYSVKSNLNIRKIDKLKDLMLNYFGIGLENLFGDYTHIIKNDWDNPICTLNELKNRLIEHNFISIDDKYTCKLNITEFNM